jgi:hypothetical protein
MIFSHSVIGRGAVVTAGGTVAPRRRAWLYANRPPCRTISAAIGSSLDRDRLAALDARQQREVGRGQQADVLAVLAVDLLDVLRDHELHAGLELRVRRRLARTAAALAEAAHDHREAAVLDRVLLHDAAAQADQAVARQRLVVVVADPARRQFVGRDVVDQLARWVVAQRRVAVELRLELLPVLA